MAKSKEAKAALLEKLAIARAKIILWQEKEQKLLQKLTDDAAKMD